MRTRIKNPPQVNEEGAARAVTRVHETSSEQSIPSFGATTKYPQHHLVGYWQGKGVYAPNDLAANRALSIEEDHNVLHALTDDELVAWKQQQYDLAMTQRLEAERERAAQAAEDWLSEVGHGLAYGAADCPAVI